QAPANSEVSNRKGWLLIVADGMGGHAAGEVAAGLAVDNIASSYLASGDDDAGVSLRRAFYLANEAVREQAAQDANVAGMGATCVAVALRDQRLYTAHAGDCRAYLFRNGGLHRLTADHSFVAQLVRENVIDEAQAM